jgi:hypothetical protein
MVTSRRNSRGSLDPTRAIAPARWGSYSIPAARSIGSDSARVRWPHSGTGNRSATTTIPNQRTNSGSWGRTRGKVCHHWMETRVRTAMKTPHSSQRTASDSGSGEPDLPGSLRALVTPVVVVDKPDPLRQVRASCKPKTTPVKSTKPSPERAMTKPSAEQLPTGGSRADWMALRETPVE